MDQSKLIAAALRRMQSLKLDECFDANNINSKPTPMQQELFKDINKVQFRVAKGGNQTGKSQTLRREVAWMFERKHPYFEIPADWEEEEPWLILVVGKVRRQIEDSLWPGIKRFLKPGSFKEVRVGPYLEKVEHKENGNTIIFLSHDNPNVAAERMQSYTAHYIGLDEMPTSFRIIEELQRRGQAKSARFLFSFTPKSQNLKIKKIIDTLQYPYGKVYKLKAFDNPIMTDKKKNEVLSSLEGYSEAYKMMVLEGEWLTGERAVYQFNPEVTIESPPETYHKGWRHIESSDPAVSSKFGFTLWAEDPATGLWYCIRDEYVEGLYVPEKIFQHVQELTRGYNIVKRICDPHETWYINTARSHGIHYQTPFDKNSRKNELIKGLQSAMISEIRIAPWCERLIEEVSNCQFREDSDKIVNSSSYHLLDTAQYFVDLKPAHDPELAPKSWEVELREANQKRKEKKASLAKQRINTGRKGRTIAQWQRRRSSL
jgi:gluconate kinase